MDIGANVFIGRGTKLDPGFVQLISIGDDTTMSSNVEVLAHDASMRRHLGYTKIARTVIGSGVYIGAGAIILPGVTVGDDAVIGAGSVVTRDVPAAAVVAGNPARQLGTVNELAAKHRVQLHERPTYESRNWTTWDGGISAANRERMRADLASGHGYIE